LKHLNPTLRRVREDAFIKHRNNKAFRFFENRRATRQFPNTISQSFKKFTKQKSYSKIYVIKNIMDTLTSVVGMESFRKLFFVSFYNINWGQNHFAPNIIEYS